LNLIENLIKAAGKLESLQGAKPGTGGKGSTGTGSNQIRSLQRATQIKADTSRRENNAQPKGSNVKKTKQGAHVKKQKDRQKLEHLDNRTRNESARDQRMEERERAAGLYLAGGDPMSGRRPSGMKAGEGEKKDKSEQQIEQLKEVNKKLSKLDGALSGDN
jgi:hypothetical protein